VTPAVSGPWSGAPRRPARRLAAAHLIDQPVFDQRRQQADERRLVVAVEAVEVAQHFDEHVLDDVAGAQQLEHGMLLRSQAALDLRVHEAGDARLEAPAQFVQRAGVAAARRFEDS